MFVLLRLLSQNVTNTESSIPGVT